MYNTQTFKYVRICKKNHIVFSPGSKDYPSPSRTPIHQPLDNIGPPNWRLGRKAVRENPTPPNSLAPEQTQSESRLSFATRLFCVEGSPGIKKNPSSHGRRRDRGAESLNRRTNKGKGGIYGWKGGRDFRLCASREIGRGGNSRSNPPTHPWAFQTGPSLPLRNLTPWRKISEASGYLQKIPPKKRRQPLLRNPPPSLSTFYSST